jgi:hypothetical protein
VPQLFPDFLDNVDSYEAVVRFWDQLVTEVERSLGQEDEWGRWIPMHYADGVTPIDTPGNPIFDGLSQRLDRGFRIIQHPPVSEEPELSAWIKTYEKFDDEPTLLPTSELVLNLSLSDESAQGAEALLRTWMQPDTTPSTMEAVIKRVAAKLQAGPPVDPD